MFFQPSDSFALSEPFKRVDSREWFAEESDIATVRADAGKMEEETGAV